MRDQHLLRSKPNHIVIQYYNYHALYLGSAVVTIISSCPIFRCPCHANVSEQHGAASDWASTSDESSRKPRHPL